MFVVAMLDLAIPRCKNPKHVFIITKGCLVYDYVHDMNKHRYIVCEAVLVTITDLNPTAVTELVGEVVPL